MNEKFRCQQPLLLLPLSVVPGNAQSETESLPPKPPPLAPVASSSDVAPVASVSVVPDVQRSPISDEASVSKVSCCCHAVQVIQFKSSSSSIESSSSQAPGVG